MVSLSYGWKANLFVFAATPFAVLLRAYTTATMWRWFVVPLGLPALGLAHAYGLWLLVNLMAVYVPAIKDKDIVETDSADKREATASEVRLWVITKMALMGWPALALLCGYVAHYLMGQ